MTNHVLVLTTSFPPDTNGRASRLRTRLKYLIRNHDWVPVVVVGQEGFERQTVTIEGMDIPVYRSNHEESDNSNDISYKGAINRLKLWIAPRLTPDHYIVRLPSIVRKIGRIIDMEKIDTLYTMCYPFTFHLAGLIVSNRRDVGWLAEFQDPWVTNPNHFDGDGGIFQQYLERQVIDSCDQVVYNYGIQVPENYFKKTYPEQADKVTRLDCPGSCGFDFERLSAHSVESGHFTIVYGGSFYGNGHSPETFIRGLGCFINRRGLDESDVTVEFYGDWKNAYDEVVADAGVEEVVESYGWVDFDTWLERIQRAHVALFIVRPFPGDELNVPQKIVDYVATETPMLVLAESDWEVSAFTRQQEIGVIAKPDDPKAVAEALGDLYDAYKQRHLDTYTAGSELLLKLDARIQTQKFAQILDDTLRDSIT